MRHDARALDPSWRFLIDAVLGAYSVPASLGAVVRSAPHADADARALAAAAGAGRLARGRHFRLTPAASLPKLAPVHPS